jgi:hypothetical protein
VDRRDHRVRHQTRGLGAVDMTGPLKPTTVQMFQNFLVWAVAWLLGCVLILVTGLTLYGLWWLMRHV